MGYRFKHAVQAIPNAFAKAFVIGEAFFGNDKVAFVLRDNIFMVLYLTNWHKSFTDVDCAAIVAYKGSDPGRYGVVEFDEQLTALTIDEKPFELKSSHAVPRLYFYDNAT